MDIVPQNVIQCAFDFTEEAPRESTSDIPTQCCTKCKQTKSLDHFSLKSRRTMKRQTWCKQCVDVYNQAYHDRVKNGILDPREKSPTKRCSLCRQYKPLDQFSRHDLAQDGLHSLCDHCLNAPTSEIAASCKKCTLCQEWLPFRYFHNNRTSRDGLTWWCKKCQNKRGEAVRSRNPNRFRNENLLHHYGISLEEYHRILQDQGGVCAACKQPETRRSSKGTVRYLAVDHDHETGQVRALLCTDCNTAYGLLHEDESRIIALLEYHRRFQKP